MKHSGLPLRAAATLAALSLLGACGSFNKKPSAGGEGPTVVRVPFSGDFTYEVDVGDEPRDVFFVFSATTDTAATSGTAVRSIVVDQTKLPFPSAPKLPATFASAYGSAVTGAQRIADFNAGAIARVRTLPRASSRASASAAIAFDAVNDTANLYMLTNSALGIFTAVPSTCRAVTGPVVVDGGGTRSLSIWVEDSQWGTITQAMVDALPARFLAAGPENDIYDWLTGILGAEWGQTPYPDLIDFTGEITILLADINRDNSPYGGIIGYFYAVNNFEDEAESNERVMFVIDAPMFANTDSDADEDNGGTGAWSADGYWPMEVYSTLAHEFQHMIHFYQKAIVADAGDVAEVWIDEFCAQLAEDLLADKMGVQGPRGVNNTTGTSGAGNNKEGRIPLYNQSTNLPLTVTAWFDLRDYSTVYAFASWAARNYGGSEFLRRVVQSPYVDARAVEQAAAAGGATPSDLDSLVGRWAVAVLNSDRTDMPAGYRSNINGWFASTTGDRAYKLGSIDYYNYLPRDYDTGEYGAIGGPVCYEVGESVTAQYAGSNVYFAASRGLTGSRKFSVSLPPGVIMHLAVR